MQKWRLGYQRVAVIRYSLLFSVCRVSNPGLEGMTQTPSPFSSSPLPTWAATWVSLILSFERACPTCRNHGALSSPSRPSSKHTATSHRGPSYPSGDHNAWQSFGFSRLNVPSPQVLHLPQWKRKHAILRHPLVPKYHFETLVSFLPIMSFVLKYKELIRQGRVLASYGS